MNFLRKKGLRRKFNNSSAKPPFYKKRGWKITFLCLGVILVFVASLLAYAVSTGSKIFKDGIGGYGLLKTIYGKERLKGEAEDRINVLFLGMGGASHPGGMLSDSIILLSIKPKEKKAAMLSVPRDLLVPIPDHGEDKINSSFVDGYNDYINKDCRKKDKEACRANGIDAGAKLESQTVANILNLPIHYYVTVDFDGFEKVIDSMGGIDVNVDKAIYDPLFPDKQMKGYEPFRISAGQHHLDGKTALKYARSRETTSDFDRASRQQKVIVAIKEKALQKGFLTNPQKMIDTISAIGNSVKTDFSLSELKTFAELTKDISGDKLISKVLSTATDGLLVDYNNGVYYQKPKSGNFKEIQKFANNIFDESSTIEITPAKIEIQNGSSISGAATKLAGILKNKGYDITEYINSKTKYQKTIIYDYSDNKQKDMLDLLKKGLNADVVKKDKQSGSNVDITIILGDDYTGYNETLN